MLDKLKDHNVLITGGSGFIGINLINKLKLSGANIFIIDKNLKNKDNSIKYIRCDIRDKKTLLKIIKKIKPSYVYHLAAIVDTKRDLKRLKEIMDINFFGTINILECCNKVNSIEGIVVLGSSDEYGKNKAPFKDDAREDPYSPYALSKTLSSHLCRFYAKYTRYSIVVLRPFIVYGPEQKGLMFIPSMMSSYFEGKVFEMGSGKQKKDFIYIDDLIKAIIKASLKKGISGEIINIGFGKPIRLLKIVDIVKKLTKNKLKVKLNVMPMRKGEVMIHYANIEKAKKLLKWRPQKDIKKGLKLTFDWWKKKS